jgi:hypothetical protein
MLNRSVFVILVICFASNCIGQESKEVFPAEITYQAYPNSFAFLVADSSLPEDTIGSTRKILLGSLHLGLTYAAMAGTTLFMYLFKDLDSLKTADTGTGFLLFFATATAMGISHLVGDVLYRADGSLGGSIGGGFAGFFTSFALSTTWNDHTTRTRKFIDLTVPTAVGLFVGYWITSRYDPFGLKIYPSFGLESESLGLTASFRY